MNRQTSASLALLALFVGCAPARAPGPITPDPNPSSASFNEPHPELAELSIEELQLHAREEGWDSSSLVEAYLERIASIDRSGPTLRSVIALDPAASRRARELDNLRDRGETLGALHGLPILVKDNIETANLPTTAGSLALAENWTRRDAPVIARLQAAGAIVLGKTNLSEWANIRSSRSVSGWSAVGGLTRNPYALDRNACGSSSGSAVAVAAGLAAAAIGTETDGSIVCPSAVNGVVGLKPSVGMVSRTGIVPISMSQDTAGPMARSVRDVALLFGAMVGADPEDPATSLAQGAPIDYVNEVDRATLEGRRIGVLRFETGYHPGLDREFERALTTLREAGAVLVEIEQPPHREPLGKDELLVLLAELHRDLDAYLTGAAEQVEVRSLEELVAFNRAHADEEMALFGQELFLSSLAGPGTDSAAYAQALSRSRRLAGPQGIDAMLERHDVELLVAPTTAPAWLTDPIHGDHFLGSASKWAAVAGYPHLTVPMGDVFGLPVGMSLFGTRRSELGLLTAGRAFEIRRGHLPRPEFRPTVDDRPDITRALSGSARR